MSHLVVGALTCMGSAEALDDADLRARFKTEGGHDKPYVMVWNKPRLRYMLVGDLGPDVKDQVASSLSSLGAATSIDMRPDTTADLFLVFDHGVFEELRLRPERFLAARIPAAVLAVLRDQASRQGWRSLCLTSAWTDGQGDIVGAVVLSQSATQACVTPPLLDVLGITPAKDETLNLKLACVLYAATAAGEREVQSLALSRFRPRCGL